VTSVEVQTIEIPRPAPIVPEVDQLDLRPVQWVVITPENVDEKFNEIKDGEYVFFALTREGYENLALNISDIRANIEQHKRVIAIYKQQF
jgi:expansin (peptidoglycan-binding protein)